MRELASCFALIVAGCSADALLPTPSGRPPATTASSLTCTPCVDSSQCSGGACAQYGGSDFCGLACRSDSDCGVGEKCTLLAAVDSSEAQLCIPARATCGMGAGCANCPSGAACDVVTGLCVEPPAGPPPRGAPPRGVPDAGASGAGATSAVCPGYAEPSSASCCQSCSAGGSSCQANGCYSGWYCDTNTCKCHAPPANCSSGASGGSLGGADAGTPGGSTGGPPPTGAVGANGGSVSSLYFAVVGDTRPGSIDATGSYPSAIIEKIYSDIAALNPQPQFVITTGDYMFASPSGNQAQAQMALYMRAAHQYTTGPIFAAMGNHECTGATASNCAASPTSNMHAYLDALVTPLGKTAAYYSVPINDANGKWSAKILIAACNAWDATQRTWLTDELSKPTTYTFVVRHEPSGTSGTPCGSEMDAILRGAKYDLFIVGHSHTFSHSGNELIIGNGGAPISGSVDYGFATIAQTASGFVVTQYDYLTAMPVSTFTVP
jgi:hypothetical protein